MKVLYLKNSPVNHRYVIMALENANDYPLESKRFWACIKFANHEELDLFRADDYTGAYYNGSAGKPQRDIVYIAPNFEINSDILEDMDDSDSLYRWMFCCSLDEVVSNIYWVYIDVEDNQDLLFTLKEI